MEGWKYWHDEKIAALLGISEDEVQDWVWAPRDSHALQDGRSCQKGNFYRDSWKVTRAPSSLTDSLPLHLHLPFASAFFLCLWVALPTA